MSEYQARRIRKNKARASPLLHELTHDKYIVGFDSEADTSSPGQPMLFQFSLPNQTEDDTLTVVVPPYLHAGLGVFLDFIDEYCTNEDVEYLIYAWNTAYELTQIFHDLPDDVRRASDFHLKGISRRTGQRYKWVIEALNYKRQILVFRKGKIKVSFLDGTAFYKTSLDKAAKMLGLGEKYALTSLSRTSFTRADIENADFLRYARRDAYITRLIGEYIQQQHTMYAIPTCISAPHFAATVFKTHFLTSPFVLPSGRVEQAGLYSYHGGKNGFYLEGPTDFPRIYQYDITSAYPEAMRQLPDLNTSDWITILEYKPGIHGLYCVDMEYNPCTYRGLQNHNGSRAEQGLIKQTWLTAYELDAILEHGEANILAITGYELVGESGGPLTEYVDTFFRIKRNSHGPERETAKLLLNSLYGKFFQKQPTGAVGTFDLDNNRWIQTDPTTKYDYEAGGLYNPSLASLITGFVRAKIHRLEHKYNSIMTSTDGLFGLIEPDLSDIGSELGQLTVEEGRLRIWRERLYSFDSLKGTKKFALHGFHSNITELEKIPLATGAYTYFGTQMITLKMSTRTARSQRYQPGEFVRMAFTLRL